MKDIAKELAEVAENFRLAQEKLAAIAMQLDQNDALTPQSLSNLGDVEVYLDFDDYSINSCLETLREIAYN